MEEVVHATGRTMALVSQRLMQLASTHRIDRATLVTRAATEPQVIHSIFGINSVKFAASFNQTWLIFQIEQFLQNLWNHQAALEMFCYLHHKGNKR